MRRYITGVASWLSQGLNAVFLNGNPDMTLSSRCYLNRDKKNWNRARKVINALFFWQENHCKASFQSDRDNALDLLSEGSNE